MFPFKKVLVTLVFSGLLAASTGQALAASIDNTSCKTIGLSKKSPGKTYVCTKSKTKLIWVLKKSVPTKLKKSVPTNESAVALPDPVPSAATPLTPSLKRTSLPTTAPESEIYWEGMTIKVAVVMPSKSVLESEGITQIQTRLKFGSVPISISGDLANVFKETERVNFSWDLSKAWDAFKLAPWNIYVELEFVNAIGSGPVKIYETALPKIVPAPTPTPTPTSPPKAVPEKPAGCFLDYKLPISATRFSIQSMTYSLDNAGYPMIDAVIKNDYAEYNGVAFTSRLYTFGIGTSNGKFVGSFNYGDAPTWLLGTTQTIRFKSFELTSCENDKFFVFTVTPKIG